jgi:PTH1 family peptidyl-tRNA hydrolase
MNETGAIRLIAGLGNAGPRYQQTRHNTGFWFVDALMRAHNGHFHVEPKFDGEAGRIGIASSNVWLFKPGAFMNRYVPFAPSTKSRYQMFWSCTMKSISRQA